MGTPSRFCTVAVASRWLKSHPPSMTRTTWTPTTRTVSGLQRRVFHSESVFSEAADTGKITAALSGDLFVSRRTPSADYAHPLDDWDFDYIGNNIFRAYLAVGRHEDGSVYTRDDLDDHPDIRALFAYLTPSAPVETPSVRT